MPLTTLPVVKALLGITVSTYDVPLQMLIDGVCEQVIRYCARNFNATNVILKDALDHNPEIVLDETPVNHILYFATGSSEVLELVCSNGDNAQASVKNTAGAGNLTLVDGMGVSADIPMALTMTLTDLETAIGLVAGWSADLQGDYGDYPANALLDQSAETEESGTAFYLKAALEPRKLVRHEAEGIYVVKGSSCDEAFGCWPDEHPSPLPFVCIYNGGYATIPAGLTLIVNQCCCDGWRNFTNNAAMKSETVGDYSYTKFDQAQIASAIGPYMSALDLYKRV